MNTEISIKSGLVNECMSFDRYLVVGGSGGKIDVMSNMDYDGMILLLAPLIETLEKYLEKSDRGVFCDKRN